MRRAYLIYILMFAVLAGGLTVVLTLGRSLNAPDDLSGQWEVEWHSDPPPRSGSGSMHVTQSGRFFVVQFGGLTPMNMVLEDGWTGKRKGRFLDMTLTRQRWTLRFQGPIPEASRFRVPEVQVVLAGPSQHRGTARRLNEAELAPVPDPVPATQPTERETAHAQ